MISKIMIIFLLVAVFFTDALFPFESGIHEALDIVGILMVFLCALGRVYTTAYLGGFKNDVLINYGPFSVVRNPLYFFSLIGFTGVAVMTTHLLVIVVMPVAFLCLYIALIKREEAFLLEKFGDDYRDYMKSVPRLVPRMKHYQAPDTIQMSPKHLNKAFTDAIWWIMAFPLVEVAEFIQGNGWIKPLVVIP